MEERAQQARNQKVQGAWAYSDAFDHIIVKIGKHWHGFKLAGAVRMREELDQAISDAEKTDAEYSQKSSEPVTKAAFSHAYDIAFEVDSQNPEEATPAEIRAALRRRLRELEVSDDSYTTEAVGVPFDTQAIPDEPGPPVTRKFDL